MKSENIFLFILIAAVVITVAIAGCTQTQEYTEEGSRDIAENFVKNSPTFKFDGFDLELNKTLYPDCENCYQFIFNFKSRHAGYGNRTGKVLAQVITPHTAVITMRENAIIRGAIDGKWGIKEQKLINRTQLPNPAAVYCEQQNGTIIIIDTEEGQAGYCKIKNKTCEEWAYYNSNGTECNRLNNTE